jgi:xanthine dehydrogenase YagT iron-sulfur-binding subunit
MSTQDNEQRLTSLEKLTRRSFLSRVGVAGIGAAAAGVAAPVAEAAGMQNQAVAPTIPALPGTVSIALRVNGEAHQVRIDPRATVLDTLRETLHLTGTKKGCDHGQCGACTIHVDGQRVNSCLLFARMQAAFVEHDGYQCGYCTSGQIMSAVAMMKEPWGPEDHEVKEALSGNICRCGAYPNIVAAVQSCRGKAAV